MNPELIIIIYNYMNQIMHNHSMVHIIMYYCMNPELIIIIYYYLNYYLNELYNYTQAVSNF